ncbi:MAG: hypothetical protein IJC52_02570 [Clostridia bacterium]|nr:hypothetical protein [Clostridia bacterium]
MKQTIKRLLSLCLISAMLAGLTACGGEPTDESVPLANGNVLTTPAEQGTEEELTAVRDNLIKLTETQGLGDIEKMEFYENGVRTTSDQYVQVKDNKKVYYAGDVKRVVNYPDGYILDIPADWTPDYSLASACCRYEGDGVTLIATNENDALKDYMYANAEEGAGKYAAAEEYIHAMFQYITNPAYSPKNNVLKLGEKTVDLQDGLKAYVLQMYLRDLPEGKRGYYTYVVCYGELTATQLMFKCVDDRDFSDIYETYQTIYDKGAPVDHVAYPEEDNPSWNAETKALYDSLMNTETVQWGLYNGNIDWDPLASSYPRMEEKLDFKFPIVSSYTDDMHGDFPVADAQKITDDGRYIQFNYHFETTWNNTMGQKAPILDVYRGKHDEDFRRFARQVVEYGQPMLFRVNNEMNSDWTSWSAVNAMCDPEIFRDTWARMYNIFGEEGANAYLIWVWNPQSEHSFPNTRWNDVRLYMPGAKYVDMLGLTAYNFGDETQWDTFEGLYTTLESYYKTDFADWGWIISEFGCSDTDPDKTRKAQWITDMFTCFEQGMFENIKAAVWFNGNDYAAGELVHEIVLNDSDESMEAFKDGLERTQ